MFSELGLGLGLDSLAGIRMLGALEDRLSMELDPLVLDHPSIAALAAEIDALAAAGRQASTDVPSRSNSAATPDAAR